jgi:hypothetical protein
MKQTCQRLTIWNPGRTFEYSQISAERSPVLCGQTLVGTESRLLWLTWGAWTPFMPEHFYQNSAAPPYHNFTCFSQHSVVFDQLKITGQWKYYAVPKFIRI